MRTRSVAWSELKLGIVGIIGAALVAIIVLAVGGQGGFFWQRYPLKTRFDDVHGLKNGAIVRLNGMEVGKVTDISFVGAQVEVSLTVAKRIRHLITDDSRASVGSLSLLGEPIIDIRGAATGQPLEDGGYLAADESGGLTALGSTAARGVSDVSALVAELRAGRGTIGRLLADDTLYSDLDDLILAAREVTHQLARGGGTLGALLHDPAAYASLNASLTELRTITGRINEGTGPLGRLVSDDSLARSLTSLAANLDRITGQLARGEGTAGQMLTDGALYARMDSVVARLDDLAADLQAGRGTAGRLLHDERLYENLDAAATELRSLVADIRRDPKQYLNVRVRIF